MISIARQAAQAARILHDWVGGGGQPVPIEQAQTRADICATCPRNWRGGWQWKMSVAEAIREQLEHRARMGIRLNDETSLGVCEVCGCALRLKVHVPFIHIARHTPDSLMAQYPEFCWQRKENKQLNP